jgi:hypothetical protein
MLRKLLFAAVTAVTLALPVVVVPGKAEAEHVEPATYNVYYRKFDHEGWRYYGSYHFREAAHDAAEHLRREGYQAEVR